MKYKVKWIEEHMGITRNIGTMSRKRTHKIDKF